MARVAVSRGEVRSRMGMGSRCEFQGPPEALPKPRVRLSPTPP